MLPVYQLALSTAGNFGRIFIDYCFLAHASARRGRNLSSTRWRGDRPDPQNLQHLPSGNGVQARDASEARIGEPLFPSRPGLVWSAIAQASGGLGESVFQWVAGSKWLPSRPLLLWDSAAERGEIRAYVSTAARFFIFLFTRKKPGLWHSDGHVQGRAWLANSNGANPSPDALNRPCRASGATRRPSAMSGRNGPCLFSFSSVLVLPNAFVARHSAGEPLSILPSGGQLGYSIVAPNSASGRRRSALLRPLKVLSWPIPVLRRQACKVSCAIQSGLDLGGSGCGGEAQQVC